MASPRVISFSCRQHVFRLDVARLAVVVERVAACFSSRDVRHARREILLEARRRLAAAARKPRLASRDVRPVDVLHLADLRRVDVEMGDPGSRRELLHLAGHAVVEARADRESGSRSPRPRSWRRPSRACRACAATTRSVVSTAPMPISVVTTGIPKRCAKAAQLGRRVAVDDAAAGIDQRALATPPAERRTPRALASRDARRSRAPRWRS